MDNRFKEIGSLRVENKKLQLRKRSLPPLKAQKNSELSLDHNSSCIDLNYRARELKFVRCISEKVLELKKIQLSCNYAQLDFVRLVDELGSNKESTPTFRKFSFEEKGKARNEFRESFFPDIGKRLIKVNSRLRSGFAADKNISCQKIVRRIKVLQHKFPKDMF